MIPIPYFIKQYKHRVAKLHIWWKQVMMYKIYILNFLELFLAQKQYTWLKNEKYHPFITRII